jgi:hypothetical protein
MTDQTDANKAIATLRPGELAKQIDALKTIVWVLAFAFTGGIIWDKLLTYQGKVDNEQVQIEMLKAELNDRLSDLKRDINSFKVNLGHLSDPSYQIEVSEEGDGVLRTGQCRNRRALRQQSQEILDPLCLPVARGLEPRALHLLRRAACVGDPVRDDRSKTSVTVFSALACVPAPPATTISCGWRHRWPWGSAQDAERPRAHPHRRSGISCPQLV